MVRRPRRGRGRPRHHPRHPPQRRSCTASRAHEAGEDDRHAEKGSGHHPTASCTGSTTWSSSGDRTPQGLIQTTTGSEERAAAGDHIPDVPAPDRPAVIAGSGARRTSTGTSAPPRSRSGRPRGDHPRPLLTIRQTFVGMLARAAAATWGLRDAPRRGTGIRCRCRCCSSAVSDDLLRWAVWAAGSRSPSSPPPGLPGVADARRGRALPP
jgi:hypothetical protein